MVQAMSDQSQLQSVLPDWRCTVGLGESQSDLLQILQSRYMHPVVLLHGPTGFGKRHLAHWFGAALLCARNTACGICGNCKEVIAGIHPDVFVVQGVDHGAIKTAEVESLQSKLDILSSSGLRIAIIPNCDRMTKEAANRLLKSLEEPPEQVRFILTTSRPKALLPTVLGRCLRFRVKPPKVELVLPWLRYEWSLASKDVFTDESLREMIHRVGNAPGELKRKIEDTSQRQDQLLQGVSSLWSARQPQDVIRIAENLA
ncbi:MAG: AAA family ATPase, partial [Proteobacteria bacterium]|nr:AAA family ATPase [Pseudomonadota bacterium]